MPNCRHGLKGLLAGLCAIASVAPTQAQQPSHEGRDEARKTLPSYPTDAPEPIERLAKVEFISNGYWLEPEHCQVIESSGDLEADRQACATVQFFKTEKGKVGEASTQVWSVQPVDGVFVRPRMTNKRAPVTPDDYPASSLKKGAQGTVTIRLKIDSLGAASDCIVLVSAKDRSLDNAACKAFSTRAKYEPATLNDRPIDAYTLESVQFYQGNGPRKSD